MKQKIEIDAILDLMQNESKKTKVTIENGEIALQTTALFKLLQNIVLKSKNAEHLFKLACTNLAGLDAEALSSATAETKDVKYNILFPNYVKGAIVPLHGKVVMKWGTVAENIYFALRNDFKGADVLSHGQIVINEGTVKDNISFASCVYGADVLSHGRITLDKGTVIDNINFAALVSGADEQAHFDMVENCGTALDYLDFMHEMKQKHERERESDFVTTYETNILNDGVSFEPEKI